MYFCKIQSPKPDIFDIISSSDDDNDELDTASMAEEEERDDDFEEEEMYSSEPEMCSSVKGSIHLRNRKTSNMF